MVTPPVRLGVIGLGRAFLLMLPTFRADPRLHLVACADPRAEARERFLADFPGARAHETAEALCADNAVEAVYVASPHRFHLDHVRAAAAAGRHILVEKPMAIATGDAVAMDAAARGAGVHLIVGHAHSFDLPYLRTAELIRGGVHGRLHMITAINFTDWLYRPRRPDELDTAQGGGVLFSQAPHQVDVVRLLAGRPALSVRAATAVWDPARGTEGAYQALLDFGDGLSASLVYSGHAHFDTDAWMEWRGELGQARDPAEYGRARAALAAIGTPAGEAALKDRRGYGAAPAPAAAPPQAHQHFGVVIASCARADLRPLPLGVEICADGERRIEPLPPPAVPRAEVVDELHGAIRLGRKPLHDGAWGIATLEICRAILDSARAGREIALRHQHG